MAKIDGENYTLHSGDCLPILKELETASIDGLITDPPYSSGGMVRSDRSNKSTLAKYSESQKLQDFAGDNRDQRGWAYWMHLWLSECMRVIKPGGVVLLFTDWRQLPTTTDILQGAGFVWRGIVPWHKPIARPTMGRFTANCEYVVWGSVGHMSTDTEQKPLPGFYSVSAPTDREHITQKPVNLMRSLVKIVPENGTVLDPFMGSGTTGVAALAENRKFVGVEMLPHFYDISVRRLAEIEPTPQVENLTLFGG